MAKRKKPTFTKNFYEFAAWQENNVVVGIDEVGRGCLAGPVVACALILPPKKLSKKLKDSKLMTADERMDAYQWIHKHCIYATGIIHHRLIDKVNIWQATLLAMKKAFVHLMALNPQKPSAILIDAMPLKLFDTAYSDIPVHHFIYGERKSSSIAAASIVAKVTRDYLMEQLDPLIPDYRLASHKGYSTPSHKKRIQELDRSIIHRLTFLDELDVAQEVQTSLFLPAVVTPELENVATGTEVIDETIADLTAQPNIAKHETSL